MKVKVNQDRCIACGYCVSTIPEVFEFDDNGLSHAKKEVPKEKEEDVKEAFNFCPGSAIEEVKEK